MFRQFDTLALDKFRSLYARNKLLGIQYAFDNRYILDHNTLDTPALDAVDALAFEANKPGITPAQRSQLTEKIESMRVAPDAWAEHEARTVAEELSANRQYEERIAPHRVTASKRFDAEIAYMTPQSARDAFIAQKDNWIETTARKSAGLKEPSKFYPLQGKPFAKKAALITETPLVFFESYAQACDAIAFYCSDLEAPYRARYARELLKEITDAQEAANASRVVDGKLKDLVAVLTRHVADWHERAVNVARSEVTREFGNLTAPAAKVALDEKLAKVEAARDREYEKARVKAWEDLRSQGVSPVEIKKSPVFTPIQLEIL